jgi:hypothetical protein
VSWGRRANVSKYGAARCRVEGDAWPELVNRSFASQLERTRAQELVLMLRAGEIRDLEFQVTVKLTDAEIGYNPDFRYFDVRLAQVVYDEAKGFETPEWILKRKLWTVYGPGRLRVVVAGRRGGTMTREEIWPKKCLAQ